MKLGEKYKALKAKQRNITIQRQISHGNVTDAIAAFLYSTSVIDDDKEITNIEILPTAISGRGGVHEMFITYHKVKKEVYKTKANGKAG